MLQKVQTGMNKKTRDTLSACFRMPETYSIWSWRGC